MIVRQNYGLHLKNIHNEDPKDLREHGEARLVFGNLPTGLNITHGVEENDFEGERETVDSDEDDHLLAERDRSRSPIRRNRSATTR